MQKSSAVIKSTKSRKSPIDTGVLAGSLYNVIEQLELLLILIDRGDSGNRLELSFNATHSLCQMLRDQILELVEVEVEVSLSSM